MDQFHNRKSDDNQLDPQLISTVTATVLQTLQASGTLPKQEEQEKRSPNEPKTIDLVGLFFALVEKFWLVALCAIMGATIMGVTATDGVTTYTATAKLYIVNTSGGTINFTNLQLGSAMTVD